MSPYSWVPAQTLKLLGGEGDLEDIGPKFIKERAFANAHMIMIVYFNMLFFFVDLFP